jgi:predicted aspartyl protease
MRGYRVFVVLIGLVVLGFPRASAGAESCSLKRISAVDITILPDGRIAVPVSIEGRMISLMVDTGSPFSMLTSAAVDQLGLRREPIPEGLRLAIFGGRNVTEMAAAHSVKIGNLSVKTLAFGALPPSVPLNGVEGLLGLDFLNANDFELDFAGNQLRFYDPDHCRGQVVYWTNDGYAKLPFVGGAEWNKHIEVGAELDGKSITVQLDTGSSVSVMSLEKAKRLFHLDDAAISPAGNAPFSQYPFEKLSFDGVEVRRPRIFLAPDKVIGASLRELILGTTVLRGLHIYVAVKERILYITAATAH